MIESTLTELVNAIGRAMQALAYYAPSHPVPREALTEAWRAAQATLKQLSRVTLATSGHELLVDADGPPLGGSAAPTLARGLFRRKLLGLRLLPTLDEESLARVVAALAEQPALLERRGGFSAAIEKASGVESVSVDFAALFDGALERLPAIIREDPILERALRSLLRFESGAGAPIEVRLEDVDELDELGTFLEGLVRRAHDERARGDDLAEAAWDAFRLFRSVAADGLAVAEGADALARALVRLPPEARFELLLRLAEGDEQGGAEVLTSARSRIDEGALIEAIAGALADRDRAEAQVLAIGRLLGHLHPVQAERRRLLTQIDHATRARARPIDGLLWQSLEARTVGDDRGGLLEVTDLDSEAGLIEHASLRSQNRATAVPGQSILHTTRETDLDEPLAELLEALLASESRLSPALISDALVLADALEARGDRAGSTGLWVALGRRGERDAEARSRFLEGMTRGGERRRDAVVAHPDAPAVVRALLLLLALETSDPGQRPELRHRLALVPVPALAPIVEGAWGPVGPQRLRVLLETALLADPRQGLGLARRVLASRRRGDAELAIEVLARAPRGSGLRFLALLAGVKGPRPALLLLELTPETKDAWPPLAERAIEALAAMSDPRATKILAYLVERPPGLFFEAVKEIARRTAARALARNASPLALEALERATKSSWRVVRAAARDARGGPSRG